MRTVPFTRWDSLRDLLALHEQLGQLVGTDAPGWTPPVDLYETANEYTEPGAGFTPDFIPRAFDRFSRADEARSEGGSGLGLAIVALIAHAHGGTAGLANRDGHGADVWIQLPRTAGQPAGEGKPPG